MLTCSGTVIIIYLLEQILGLKWCRSTPGMGAFIAARRSSPIQWRGRAQRASFARSWGGSNRLCRRWITCEGAFDHHGGCVVGTGCIVRGVGRWLRRRRWWWWRAAPECRGLRGRRWIVGVVLGADRREMRERTGRNM